MTIYERTETINVIAKIYKLAKEHRNPLTT